MYFWRSVYDQVREEQEEIYKIQNYPIIQEYQSKPIFPPPLSLFYYIFVFLTFFLQFICKKNNKIHPSGSENANANNSRLSSNFKFSDEKNFFGLN